MTENKFLPYDLFKLIVAILLLLLFLFLLWRLPVTDLSTSTAEPDIVADKPTREPAASIDEDGADTGEMTDTDESDVDTGETGDAEEDEGTSAKEIPALSIFPPEGAIQEGEHEFQGTAAPDTGLSIFLDDMLVETIESDADGNWDAVLDLLAGELTIRMIEEDTGIPDRISEASVNLTVEPIPKDPSPAPVGNRSDCGEGQIERNIYIVNYCENLTRIAKRLGVSLAELLNENTDIVDPNLIYPGQRLVIP